MRISLVIPIFNEEGNIGRLVEESFKVIPETILGEIIVVDDGSSDNSQLEVCTLQNSYGNLRIIRHHTNAGQSAGLRSGVEAASFAIIAQMDGDGQNDPSDIEKLHARLGRPDGERVQENIALVGGIRTSRQDSGSKRYASIAANKIRDWVLRDGCPDTGCGIKLYWREAFLRLPFFSSLHRFLPTMFQAYGYSCEYVPVKDRPRLSGVSKYNNLTRALIGIYDLVGVSWLRKRTVAPKIRQE